MSTTPAAMFKPQYQTRRPNLLTQTSTSEAELSDDELKAMVGGRTDPYKN